MGIILSVEISLFINKKIEIARLNEDDVFKSLVQSVDNNIFTIQLPTKGHERLILQQGDQVEVSYIFDGGRIMFESTVVGRLLEESVPLYKLAIPQEAKRIQLRQHVRLDIALEISYQKVTKDEDNKLIIDDKKKRALTRDISGGGLQFIAREQLESGSLVLINLDLAGWNKKDMNFSILSVIKRVIGFQQNGRTRWTTGAAFIDIDSRDQDTIISFVFKKMIERRRMVRD